MKKLISLFLMIVFTVFALSYNVTVNAEYVNKETEFRAVWVTPWGGDGNLVTYSSEANFKSNMNYIFEVMEENNLNALIYHVRTHNNALYDSVLNPKASYWENVNFNTFDPLEWAINEAHKRGIEFHAWLNPYRISSSASATAENIATQYASYPANPASNANNILITTSGAILNPGIPAVRSFIVDTIEEIIDNYDVDAIHFDDYFYANLGANGATSGGYTILDEADQTTFETYKGSYNITNATDKANWRRDQINLLIESISNTLRDKSAVTGKYVQFGIAPTGIYKNGNGVVTYDANGNAITTGSLTNGQTHYSSYLFCDSLKWINEEWIDYILPQSYWGISHPAAGFEKVMSWWDKVVKNKKVNLYSGIGLYMAYTGTVLTKNNSGEWISASNTYSWETDPDELEKQLTYITTLENVSGASIYNFSNFRKKHDNSPVGDYVITQMENISSTYWNKVTLLPEIKNANKVTLGKVENLSLNAKTLSWDRLVNAKYYAIYRSNTNITFDESELIDIVGGDVTSYTDSVVGYDYGIKAISYSNTLGEGINLNNIQKASIIGAQVRTTGNAGIRFVGKIDSTCDKSQVDKYGIALAFGEASANNNFVIGGLVNNKIVISIEVADTNANGLYYGTLYDIPEDFYMKDISARAYIKLKNGNYVYSDTVVTRSLANISYLSATDGYLTSGNIIDTVVNSINSNYKKVITNDDNTISIKSGLAKESDLTKLKDMFIADYNKTVGSNLTVDSTANDWYNDAKSKTNGTKANNKDISDSKICLFFNNNIMESKWDWLLEFIKSVDGTTHCTNQILAIQEGGTKENGSGNLLSLYEADHFIYSLYNFFNKDYKVGSYTAINFTQDSKYENFDSYNGIYVNLSDYEIVKVGSNYTMPSQLIATSGKAWDGWYINDSKYDAGSTYTISSSDVTITPRFIDAVTSIGNFTIAGYNTQGTVGDISANNGIRMYASTFSGSFSGVYWHKIAIKWDSDLSQYKVINVATSGNAVPTDYDYLILMYSSAEGYSNFVNIGVKIGDIIVLSEIPTTNGLVNITATVNRP